MSLDIIGIFINIIVGHIGSRILTTPNYLYKKITQDLQQNPSAMKANLSLKINSPEVYPNNMFIHCKEKLRKNKSLEDNSKLFSGV